VLARFGGFAGEFFPGTISNVFGYSVLREAA